LGVVRSPNRQIKEVQMLAVISLFICTLPVWLTVLVVVLLLR
jgi:hypothetical protein